MGDGITGGAGDTGRGDAQSAWRVRIRSRQTGEVIGSGVLLDGDMVLTCAHVVGDPKRTVTVDFPEIEGAVSSAATVRKGCWFPRGEGQEERGDLALLRLHRPPPGRHSAPLLRAALPRGTRVEMCGYPESVRSAQGVAFEATVSMPFGERVQLNVRPAHLPRRGFSGGPVLDMKDPPHVLGITVTRYADSGAVAPLTMAHMIPVETILMYMDWLKGLTGGLPGVNPALTSQASSGGTTDAEYAGQLAAWLAGDGASPVHVTEVDRGSKRDRTLQRALALAGRELSVKASTVSTDPPETIPPVGSLDLAVDARGATVDQVVVQVAERMNLKESDPERVLERLREDRMPLTIAVLGVNEAADPRGLVELCGEFADRGCRQLLVFYGTDTRIDEAMEEALVSRHRMGALTERLGALDERLRDLAPAVPRLSGIDLPDRAVSRLHMDLAWLRHAHRTGADLSPRRIRAALNGLEHRTERAERDTTAAEETARSGYERRAALRAELLTYQRLAAQHGRVEDVDLHPEYRAARRALYIGPFKPESAAKEVARYVAAVRRVLEWSPQEPQEPEDPERAEGPEGAR